MKKKKRKKPIVLRGEDVALFINNILDKCSYEDSKKIQKYLNKEFQEIFEIKEVKNKIFYVDMKHFIHLEILV